MSLRVLLGTAAIAGAHVAPAAPAIVHIARSGDASAPALFVDGNADRGKYALSTDAAGNTYVVGSRKVGADWRIATTKYAPDGGELWTATQPATTGAPANYPYAVRTDAAGNVYVAATNYVQFVTLKYDANGAELWDRRYSVSGGLYQQPRAMAVDAAGNVWVTGRSQANGFGIDAFDYGTVKYDTDGNALWTARYNGPAGLDEEVTALALDDDGAVYVTGASKAASGATEFATVKYDAAGAEQWVSRYGTGLAGGSAFDIVVNGASVVVAGQSNFSGNYDGVVVAYDRMTGVQQWVDRINGSGASGPVNDGARAITCDAQGNLYVAGHVWDSNNGFLMVKYDSAGVRQWMRNWSPYAGISGSNIAYSVAMAPDGGVVAAGAAIGSSGFDYGVVKYDASGNPQWSQLFNPAPGNLWDAPGAVSVRNDGVVVVAGTEAYSQGANTGDRRTTIFIADGVQATTPRFTIAPSVTGQPYVVNVSVRGKAGFPAGSVQVVDSDGGSCGIVLAAGDGSCTLPNATAGTKSLAATFSSDQPALFDGSSASTTHIVDKATTLLSLAAPSRVRPFEAFGVTVDFRVAAPGAGAPAGNLVVGDGVDSCTIAPPATSCNLFLTTSGTRTLQAAYAGDANFLPANATAAVRVKETATATDDHYGVGEDNLMIVVAGAGVIANDNSDDAFVVTNPGTIQAGGIGGTVTLAADGSFEYDPPLDANGDATFAYTASDGIDTVTGNVTIDVQPLNDPPTFTVGASPTHAAATTGPQAVPGFVQNLRYGGADEANQSLLSLAATITSDANHVLSSASLDLDGTLHYTLTGHGGTATVSVVARDDGGDGNGNHDTSAPVTFTIAEASGVDLAVSVDNGRSYLPAGSSASWTVEVNNSGPDTANAAQVVVTKPTNLNGYAWTCTRSDAVACPAASGTSAVSHTLNVPVGTTVTYHVSGTIAALPEQPVMLTAGATAAGSQTEMTPANNTASDNDPVGIFANGFEG